MDEETAIVVMVRSPAFFYAATDHLLIEKIRQSMEDVIREHTMLPASAGLVDVGHEIEDMYEEMDRLGGVVMSWQKKYDTALGKIANLELMVEKLKKIASGETIVHAGPMAVGRRKIKPEVVRDPVS